MISFTIKNSLFLNLNKVLKIPMEILPGDSSNLKKKILLLS